MLQQTSFQYEYNTNTHISCDGKMKRRRRRNDSSLARRTANLWILSPSLLLYIAAVYQNSSSCVRSSIFCSVAEGFSSIKQQHPQPKKRRDVLSSPTLDVSSFGIPTGRQSIERATLSSKPLSSFTTTTELYATHDKRHEMQEDSAAVSSRPFDAATSTSTPNAVHSTKSILSSTIHKFFVSLLATCTVLLCTATTALPPAHAGFGPSSGATTSSPPGLRTPQVEEGDLNNKIKKLQQIIGSTLDERRLEQFSAQLDSVMETIRLRQSVDDDDEEAIPEQPPATASPLAALLAPTNSNNNNNDDDDSVMMIRAQALQEQILKREVLLEQLEAQPYGFNYLAAFIGSVASTLVMHPVDTIKTRLQVKNSSPTTTDTKGKDGMEQTAGVVMVSMGNATLYDDDEPHSNGGGGPGVRWMMDTTKNTTVGGTATVLESATTTTTQVLERSHHEDALASYTLVKPGEEEELSTTEYNDLVAHNPSSVATAATTTSASASQPLFGGDLYKGLTGNIIKEGPPSALYLGVYESVKYSLLARFPDSSSTLLLLIYLASGAAGELVGSVVRAPAEAVKSLVQADDDGTTTTGQAFGYIMESKGNIVRAWSASIWRDVPFGAIQLAIFELVKAYILNNPDIVDFDSSTLFAEAVIGAFAGGVGSLVTNPADVVTTRIITQCGKTSGNNVDNDDEPCVPLGVIGMARLVYNEGGLGAFFTGWQARVGYWAPSISIFLTVYCSVRQAGVRYDFLG